MFPAPMMPTPTGPERLIPPTLSTGPPAPTGRGSRPVRSRGEPARPADPLRAVPAGQHRADPGVPAFADGVPRRADSQWRPDVAPADGAGAGAAAGRPGPGLGPADHARSAYGEGPRDGPRQAPARRGAADQRRRPASAAPP